MSSNDRPGSDAPFPRQRAAWIDADSPAGEVFVGESRIVGGGAKVSGLPETAPAPEPAEAGRPALSEAEIEASGLLRERVIEIGEMREEAVVAKRAFVREELVVRRDVEERTERIADTVRRTEVDVERLGPVAEGEAEQDAPDR